MATYRGQAAATGAACRKVATGSASAPAVSSSTVERLRYLTFGRAVPAVLFGLLAYLQGRKLVTDTHGVGTARELALFTSGALYLAFTAIPVVIYLTRPVPRARDGRVIPRLAAFGGTTIQLLVGILVSNVFHISAGPVLMRNAAIGLPLELAAFALAVYSLLYLRRNLSVIPEARKLVTGGPYSLVRHPLYLAEIAAAAGRTIAEAALLTIAVLAALVALQLIRARFEERLLSSVFSEYSGYAARTSRLIPGVW